MKWVNHKLITGSIVYITTNDLLLTTSAMIGSIIPDALEFPPWHYKDKWSYLKQHRKITHWMIPYLFLLTYILYLRNVDGITFINTIGLGIILGAIFHIIEDGICGTIPSLDPRKRIGVLLFKTGAVIEYLLSLVLFYMAIYIRYAKL